MKDGRATARPRGGGAAASHGGVGLSHLLALQRPERHCVHVLHVSERRWDRPHLALGRPCAGQRGEGHRQRQGPERRRRCGWRAAPLPTRAQYTLLNPAPRFLLAIRPLRGHGERERAGGREGEKEQWLTCVLTTRASAIMMFSRTAGAVARTTPRMALRKVICT